MLEDNYAYVLADRKSGTAALVDPTEPGLVMEARTPVSLLRCREFAALTLAHITLGGDARAPESDVRAQHISFAGPHGRQQCARGARPQYCHLQL